jgi:hypothetical protein
MRNGLLTAAVAGALVAGAVWTLEPSAEALGSVPAPLSLMERSPTTLAGGVTATVQNAGIFQQWLSASAPECVPVSEIGSVSRVFQLSEQQFEFARALYVALPPVSRSLPPGDSAVIAVAGGKFMVALVTNGEACARFLAPDFILSMLAQVGRGEGGAAGQPI